MAQPERPGPRRRRRPGASSRSPAASAPASAAVSVTAAAAAAAPEGGKRRRGRPRIRTELELEQRRKAWYRRRYVCSVYLGQQCERWKRIRHQLGHSKDEQTAQRLLDCFTARSRGSYSGKVCSAENLDHLHTSCDALRLLMVWSHQHSQECGFIPNLKSIASGRLDDSDSPTVLWSCAGGHSYTWEMLPPRRGAEAGGAGPGEGRAGRPTPRGAAGRTRRRVLSSLPPDGKRSHPGPREGSPSQQEAAPVVGETAKERDTPASSGSATPQGAEGPAVPAPPALPRGSPERPSEGQGIQAEPDRGAPSPPGSGTGTGTTTTTPPGRTRRARRKTGQPAAPTPTGNADLLQLVCESDSEEQPVNTARDTGEQLQQQEGSQESEMQVAETELLLTSDNESEEDEELLTEVESEDEYQFFDDPKDENYIPSSESGSDREKRRGRPRRNSTKKPPPEEPVNRKPTKRRVRRDPSEQPKKIRKKVPKQYVRCEFEGCGKIVSNPQYLKRHMKYQHLLHRTFACSHPSCGRIFRFKTQMEDHERLHSDQRNYICEFCGRAFKTDKNLVVHRRIHTGEKPLQCEICGFTCRQKASLNWHMKKHDAEAGYQFSCEVCGKRFEKKDNVSAHKSKSHPEVLLSSVAGLTGLEEGGAYSEGPSLVPETPSAHPGPLETEGWARLDQGSCLEGGIRLEVWTRLEQGSGHLGPGRGLEDGESHLAAEEP